ncbi:MAG: hypothetical protein HY540_02580 [Deltaproteobacteria bacterium]|nr:hypothetical protein [Deltaproteobacteria bacterium]
MKLSKCMFLLFFVPALWGSGCGGTAGSSVVTSTPACGMGTVSLTPNIISAVTELCTFDKETSYKDTLTRLLALSPAPTTANCDTSPFTSWSAADKATFCSNPDDRGVTAQSSVWEIVSGSVSIPTGLQTYSETAVYGDVLDLSQSSYGSDDRLKKRDYLDKARSVLFLTPSSCTPVTATEMTYKFYDYDGNANTGTITVSCPTCTPASSCSQTTCSSDADCASSDDGAYCNTSTNVCVACTSNAHCSAGKMCSSNACVDELTANFSATSISAPLILPEGNCSGDGTCTFPASIYYRETLTLTFAASVSGGTAPYSYAWDLDTDGDSDNADFVSGTATFSQTGYPAEVTLRLRVTDANNNIVYKTKEIAFTY